jgi:SHS2 domain-containing protein
VTHAFDDHTAEVRLRIEAPTLAALYAEAVEAVAELMATDPGAPTDGAPVAIDVRAADAGALLVELVNEIVFQSETRKKVFSRATIDVATETRVAGALEGFAARELKTAVKAATFHDLSVARGPNGWTARVVLDV